MISYIEKGLGLHEAIEEAGYKLVNVDGNWITDDPVAVQSIIDNYQPPELDPKMVGFEFEGVMCSATAYDQNGLTAVLLAIQLQGETFPSTLFEFENGNSLVINTNNYQQFMNAWIPFRQSFFLSEGTE